MLFKFVVPGLAVVAMAASAQTTPAPNVKIVEEIVAKVNGEIITRGDLEEADKEIEAAGAQSGLKGPAREEKVKAMEANVLKEKIDRLLLRAEGQGYARRQRGRRRHQILQRHPGAIQV